MSEASSIIALLRDLVAVPSRGGVDDYKPVIGVVERWLASSGISARRLTNAKGQVVALVATFGPVAAPSHIALNATLDTAGFGDVGRWSVPPTSAETRDGWLYGRGAADSKAGVAIFCHLARDLLAERQRMTGALTLLFDVDEHTGGFAGVRQYIADTPAAARPTAVYIGYPGNDRIVVGSRGFERAVIVVSGRAAHSGASRERGSNAVLRAARLAERLTALALPARDAASFPLPPQVTVTAMHGGDGFSMVPDACTLNVDVRLTTTFDAPRARETIAAAVAAFDAASPDELSTQVEWSAGWPAFRIADDHPAVRALVAAATATFGRRIDAAVAGPSNVGNYFATLGIPAVSGFGVTYRSIHAPDECMELASIDPVYQAYRQALRGLLGIA